MNFCLNLKMTHQFLFIFISLTFVQTLFGQERELIDKVIGIVGNEVILFSDVEEQHALMQAQNGVAPPEARCMIFDNLLASKLLLNQAKLDSIEVTDEEVDEQLNARIERILTYMNNDLAQFEDYYGQSINEVKEQFREDLKGQLLTERMQGSIMGSIKVTPGEVKDFFDQIPQDSLPYFNSEVELSEIVYKPKVNDEQKQIAISKLEDIRKRVTEGGEDFAELAKIYSDDPSSGKAGGDLGNQKRGTFVPEFEAAAFNLEPEEYSEVIESEFGFHLIQLLERRGNTIHTRHILVKPEITDADLELAQEKLEDVRQLIIADSITFLRAVKKYSDENAQSYNNGGRMVNPQTGNTFFEIADLEPEIYFTIDTMEVNGVSSPIPFTSPSGEKAFRIVWLQVRTTPHKASLKQDYNKIQTAAIEQKKAKFTSEWVEKKSKSTFISIDDIYKDCEEVEKWLHGGME